MELKVPTCSQRGFSVNRGPNSCNLAFFWFSKTYRCCRTYSSSITPANDENVITLVVEGNHATTLKLGSSYDSTVKTTTTRIHRAKETTEAASQTRGEVVQDDLGIVARNVTTVRNVFVGNEGHHLEHGSGSLGEMGDDETMHYSRAHRLRVHLLVVLANHDEMREPLFSRLLAHFHEIMGF